MKFAKVVFLIAGIYGLIAMAPMYFLESRIATQSPPAITHPEFFYGFVGLGVAWQVLFLVIARDPTRFRPAMIPSIVEKVTFGVSTIALYLANRVALDVTVLSCIDLLLAALFVVSFFKTDSRAAHGTSEGRR
jgi:hypothetical protein